MTPGKTLWEELSAPWRACVELAWAAYCQGSLPAGAVITDAQGKVIARGRHLGSPGDTATHALAKSAVGHAELVALSSVKRPRSLAGCVLYCSTEPCLMCAAALAIAGLAELRFASHDPVGGGQRLLAARFPKVRVQPPRLPLLDVLMAALAIERALRQGGPAARAAGRLRKARPRAAAFAAYLAKRRILERYARARAPAEGMLNTLEREFRARDWKPARGSVRAD